MRYVIVAQRHNILDNVRRWARGSNRRAYAWQLIVCPEWKPIDSYECDEAMVCGQSLCHHQTKAPLHLPGYGSFSVWIETTSTVLCARLRKNDEPQIKEFEGDGNSQSTITVSGAKTLHYALQREWPRGDG